MPPTEHDVAAADERFKAWMRLNLEQAATHFGVVTTGEPVFGWRLRSIGAAAIADEGPRWLRVVSEFPQFARGDTWTGNLDSNSITGIAKPQILAVHEWTEHNWRRQRAELMTQLPGVRISDTSHLTHQVALRPDWWMALRQAIDAIRATPTSRTNCDANTLDDRLTSTYGVTAQACQWETVHGDLHWQNLLGPRFGLLDWELWGTGPAGTDAATLLLYSIGVPKVFETVRETFAEQLETESGRIAQLAVGARLLSRIRGGDFPELAKLLNQYLNGLGVAVT